MKRADLARAGLAVLFAVVVIVVAIIYTNNATSGLKTKLNRDSRTISSLQRTVSGLQANVTTLQDDSGGISLTAAQVEELNELEGFTADVCTNPDVNDNGTTVSAQYPCKSG
jgi:hypothetical protein